MYICRYFKMLCNYIQTVSLFISAMLFSSLAFANDNPSDPDLNGSNDIGTVAQKLHGEAVSVKSFFWMAAQVAGIVMAIKGCQMWYKASHNDDGSGRHTHGKAILIILAGASMFFLPEVMGVGASSLLGNM